MPHPTRQIEIRKLSPVGQLLVWAARSWVQSFTSGHMLPAHVRERLQAGMLNRAWCELSELLRLLVPRNLDPDGFAADGTTTLAPSESALLELLRLDAALLDAAGGAAPDMPPAIRREADRRCTRLIDAVRYAGYHLEVDTIRLAEPQALRCPGYTPVLGVGAI